MEQDPLALPSSSKKIRKGEQLLPRIKRPPAALSITEKIMIQNTYKYVYEEEKKLLTNKHPRVNKVAKKTSEILGIGITTVYTVLKEFRENKTVRSPLKTGPKRSILDKLDDSTMTAIQQKVHALTHDNVSPTINKVHQAVIDDPVLPNFSRSTMRKVLKHLNFKFAARSNKGILIDGKEKTPHRMLDKIRPVDLAEVLWKGSLAR